MIAEQRQQLAISTARAWTLLLNARPMSWAVRSAAARARIRERYDMAELKNNGTCKQHSGLIERLGRLEDDVDKSEAKLERHDDQLSTINSNYRVIKILLGLAVLAAFLGSAIGEKVWPLLGF